MNPMYPTNDDMEDTDHFSLLCPTIDIQRQDLLAEVSELLRPFVEIDTLPKNVLAQYLLHGNEELSNDVNKKILEQTLNFTHKKVGLIKFKLFFYAIQPPCPLPPFLL